MAIPVQQLFSNQDAPVLRAFNHVTNPISQLGLSIPSVKSSGKVFDSRSWAKVKSRTALRELLIACEPDSDKYRAIYRALYVTSGMMFYVDHESGIKYSLFKENEKLLGGGACFSKEQQEPSTQLAHRAIANSEQEAVNKATTQLQTAASAGSEAEMLYCLQTIKAQDISKITDPLFPLVGLLKALARPEAAETIHPAIKTQIAICLRPFLAKHLRSCIQEKTLILESTKKELKGGIKGTLKTINDKDRNESSLRIELEIIKGGIDSLPDTSSILEEMTLHALQLGKLVQCFDVGVVIDLARDLWIYAEAVGGKYNFEKILFLELVLIELKRCQTGESDQINDVLKKLDDFSLKNSSSQQVTYELVKTYAFILSEFADGVTQRRAFDQLVILATHSNWKIRAKVVEVLITMSNPDEQGLKKQIASLLDLRLNDETHKGVRRILEHPEQTVYEKKILDTLWKPPVDLDAIHIKLFGIEDKIDKLIGMPVTDRWYSLRQVKLGNTEIKAEMAQYVDVFASKSIDDSAGQPLSTFIEKQYRNSKTNVMLLTGQAGGGKSTFSRIWSFQEWQKWTPQAPVPLMIHLPSTVDPYHDLIQKELKGLGFTDVQIDELKRDQRFVFILDGFDELRQVKNILVTNKMEEWNALIVVLCRAEYLKDFTPKQVRKMFSLPNATGGFDESSLQELRILPFNQQQIDAYLNKLEQEELTSQTATSEKWTAQKFKKMFKEIPGLQAIIASPILLKITTGVLPKLVSQIKHRDLVVSLRDRLYEAFVDQWIEHELDRLLHGEESVYTSMLSNINVDKVSTYCRALAKEMFIRDSSVLTLIPDDEFDEFNNTGQADEKIKKLLDFSNPGTCIRFNASPTTKVANHTVSFIHASLIEYFVALEIFQSVLTNDGQLLANSSTKVVSKPTKAVADGFAEMGQRYLLSQKSLTREPSVVNFLVDKVNRSESFLKKLFEFVEASKNSTDGGIILAASNALMVLAAARVPIIGKDFSNIRIKEVDLTGIVLSRVNLSGASFKEVNFSNAAVINCDLNQVEFDSKCIISSFTRTKLFNLTAFSIQSKDQIVVITGDKSAKITNIEFKQSQDIPLEFIPRYSTLFAVGGKLVTAFAGHNQLAIYELDRSITPLFQQKSLGNVIGLHHTLDAEVLLVFEDGSVSSWVNNRDFLKTINLPKVTTISGSWLSNKTLLIASGNTLILYDLSKFGSITKVNEIELEKGVTEKIVQMTSFDKSLLIGTCDGFVYLFNIDNGDQVEKRSAHQVITTMLPISNNEFITTGTENTIILWSLDSTTNHLQLTCRRDLPILHHEKIVDLSLTDDKSELLVVTSSGYCGRIFFASFFANSFEGYGNYELGANVTSLAMVPESKRCITGATDGVVKFWDMERMVEVDSFTLERRDKINHIALFVRNDGKEFLLVAAENWKNTLQIYDMETHEKLGEKYCDEFDIARIVILNNNKIGLGVDNGKFIILDLTDPKTPLVVAEHDSKSYVAISSITSIEDHVIIGRSDGQLDHIDIRDPSKTQISLSLHKDQITQFLVVEALSLLLSISKDGSIKKITYTLTSNGLKLENPIELIPGEFEGTSTYYTAMFLPGQLSNKETLVYAADNEGIVSVINLSTDQVVKRHQVDFGQVQSIQFDPESNTMITAGFDSKSIALWKIQDDGVSLDLTKRSNPFPLWDSNIGRNPPVVRAGRSMSITERSMIENEGAMKKKFGNRFFGPSEWLKCLAVEVDTIPPLSPAILQKIDEEDPFMKGRKIYQTHVLHLIPAAVNGKTLVPEIIANLMINMRFNSVNYKFYGHSIKQYAEKCDIKYISSPTQWVLRPLTSPVELTDDSFNHIAESSGYTVSTATQHIVSVFLDHLKVERPHIPIRSICLDKDIEGFPLSASSCNPCGPGIARYSLSPFEFSKTPGEDFHVTTYIKIKGFSDDDSKKMINLLKSAGAINELNILNRTFLSEKSEEELKTLILPMIQEIKGIENDDLTGMVNTALEILSNYKKLGKAYVLKFS